MGGNFEPEYASDWKECLKGQISEWKLEDENK
jgi:hypothetical protein